MTSEEIYNCLSKHQQKLSHDAPVPWEAFIALMVERTYGIEETRDAWIWFLEGFNVGG